MGGEEEGEGARWMISKELLENRDVFPPDEIVQVRVTTTFTIDESMNFTTEVGVKILYSPVVMVVKSNTVGTVFYEGGEEGERFFLDFGDSYTDDGVVGGGEGEWEWEWDWKCVTPERRGEGGEGAGEGEGGRECEYEGGKRIEMPGRGEERFEGEEGERLKEGIPLFFSVRTRVREREGEGRVVAEGRWSGVVNPLVEEGEREGERGLELLEDSWVCSDSSVGYLVIFFFLILNYNFTFNFFLFILILNVFFSFF